MKKYIAPEIEICSMDNRDLIATSSPTTIYDQEASTEAGAGSRENPIWD